jgi:hypothetical protein
MAMMLTRAVTIFLVTIITKAESWMLKAGREKDGKAELVEGSNIYLYHKVGRAAASHPSGDRIDFWNLNWWIFLYVQAAVQS